MQSPQSNPPRLPDPSLTAMERIWLNLPVLGKCFIFLLPLTISWSFFSDAVRSPEQQVVTECRSKLHNAAYGSLSGSQLEQPCLLMLRRGQL
ncbi:hypothetical protein IFO70_18930 [Phormidium tenue FACHB-886]|nr:hypothetical protein [Phormidium tenue FACHB-886]